MQNNDDKTFSRREFLRLAAMVAGAAAVTGGGFVAYRETHPGAPKGIVRLNPAFRVKEISANEIELCTHLGNGEVLQHRFSGLEADLFRELANEREIEKAIPALARKHHLSVEDCKKQVNQSIQEFSQVGLVYMGEKILVKIQEANNG
jgi:hypothetical protein